MTIENRFKQDQIVKANSLSRYGKTKCKLKILKLTQNYTIQSVNQSPKKGYSYGGSV